MTKNPLHDGTVELVQHLLMRLLPLGWFVRVQSAVVTPDSVPEPDVVVVRGDPGRYRHQHPSGADIALIVEVAESSLQRDRSKAAIFSRAGVPCYWIVNLIDQQVEVFSDPQHGVYQARQALRGSDPLPVMIESREVAALSPQALLP
jgi:Uma2 family endonuclease